MSLRAARLGLSALTACPKTMLAGMKWLWNARVRVNMVRGVHSLKAQGEDHLSSVSYETRGRRHELSTSLLLTHDGVIPNTWLSMSAGIRHHFDSAQSCWVPDIHGAGSTSRDCISIIGDGARIGGAAVAALQGERVAYEVDAYLRTQHRAMVTTDSRALRRQRRLRRFLDCAFPPTADFQLPADETIVCRCEEVSAGEIRQVAARGCMGPNQGKAFTRCGMGPCMGRKCALTVSQVMADARGVSVGEIGHYRIRSPIRPITVGQLADMALVSGEDKNAS